MYKYLVKRILLMIPTVIGAGLIIFSILRLVPGDVCELKIVGAGLYVDKEKVELCRQ